MAEAGRTENITTNEKDFEGTSVDGQKDAANDSKNQQNNQETKETFEESLTNDELKKLNKGQIEEYARQMHGVELDARKTKDNMIQDLNDAVSGEKEVEAPEPNIRTGDSVLAELRKRGVKI